MAEPPWILRHGLVVIGGRDLGLPQPTIEQLVADVRQFHRDSALPVLLRLNLAVTHHRPLDQADLVRRWLPDLAEQLFAVMRETKATEVFHERQVLNLIRFVILFATPDAGRRCDRAADFTFLVRLLLQITDVLIEQDYQNERNKRTWLFASFTRTELFMHDEHRVPTFAQVTGLAIEDYIGLGFGLLTEYDTIDAALMGHAEIGSDRLRHRRHRRRRR